MTVLTVRSAVLPGQRLLGSGGQTNSAQLTGELTLGPLELPEATGTTEQSHLVIVLTSSAFRLAVIDRSGSNYLRHLILITLGTGSLLVFRVVKSDGTFRANLFCFVKVSAWRTWNALVINDHLAGLALETFLKDDRARVKESSR